MYDIFIIFIAPLLILLGIFIAGFCLLLVMNICNGNAPWDEKYKEIDEEFILER